MVAIGELSKGKRNSHQRPRRDGPRNERRPRKLTPRERYLGGDEYGGDEGSLHSAVKLLEESTQFRDQARFKFLMACCYRDLEQVTNSAGADRPNATKAEADIRYEEMASILLTDLVDSYPENASYRYELVETLRRSHVEQRAGGEEKGEEYGGLEIALKNVNLLVRRHPNQPKYLESRMHVLQRMGHSLRNQARDKGLSQAQRDKILVAAIDTLEKASQDAVYLVVGWPDVALWRIWEVVVEASVAEALLMADKEKEALERVRSSVNAFEQICQSESSRAQYADELPAIQSVLRQVTRKVDSLELESRLMSALKE